MMAKSAGGKPKPTSKPKPKVGKAKVGVAKVGKANAESKGPKATAEAEQVGETKGGKARAEAVGQLQREIDEAFERMLGPDADPSVFEDADVPSGWKVAQDLIGRPGYSVAIDHNIIGCRQSDSESEGGEYDADDGDEMHRGENQLLRDDDFHIVGKRGKPITAQDVLKAFRAAAASAPFDNERTYFFGGLTVSDGHAEPSSDHASDVCCAEYFQLTRGISPEEAEQLYVVAFNWTA
jgi:hypothetical protein